MVGFTSELGKSLDHHANLRSRNIALIFGQRKYLLKYLSDNIYKNSNMDFDINFKISYHRTMLSNIIVNNFMTGMFQWTRSLRKPTVTPVTALFVFVAIELGRHQHWE